MNFLMDSPSNRIYSTVTFHVDTAEINHSVFDRLTGGGRRKKNRVKEDAELSAGVKEGANG